MAIGRDEFESRLTYVTQSVTNAEGRMLSSLNQRSVDLGRHFDDTLERVQQEMQTRFDAQYSELNRKLDLILKALNARA